MFVSDIGAPVRLPVADIDVDDLMLSPRIAPVVVDMVPFVVDMFPNALIVPLVVELFPHVVMVPDVVVLPVANIVNC